VNVVDVRRLGGNSEHTVVAGLGYFPVIAASDTDNLLVILRGGAGHLGLGGRLDAVRSSDGGATWTEPVTIGILQWVSAQTEQPYSAITGRAAMTKTASGKPSVDRQTRASSGPRMGEPPGVRISS